MSGNPTTTEKKCHEKAVFALYLNQAVHNIETSLATETSKSNFGEIKKGNNDRIPANYPADTDDFIQFPRLTSTQIESLENNYFRFLRFETLSFSQKKDLLNLLLVYLNRYRNYYSHLVHEDVFSLDLTDRNANRGNIKNYLERKLEDALMQVSKNYSQEELKHVKNDFRLFTWESEADSDEKIARVLPTGILFLASFFLDKTQVSQMMKQMERFAYHPERGSVSFKQNHKQKFKATIDVFRHFHMVRPSHSNIVASNPHAKSFLMLADYLNKIPEEAILPDDSKEGKYLLTGGDLNEWDGNQSTKDKLADSELFGKYVKGRELFVEQTKEILGAEFNESELNQLIQLARKTPNLRSTKDRFTDFSLTFIEEFGLMPDFQFARQRIYTKEREKVIKKRKMKIPSHEKELFFGKPPQEIVRRQNEMGKVEIAERYPYFVRNNQVLCKTENYALTSKALSAISQSEFWSQMESKIQEKCLNHLRRAKNETKSEEEWNNFLRGAKLNEEQQKGLLNLLLQKTEQLEVRYNISTHEIKNIVAYHFFGNAKRNEINKKFKSFFTGRIKFYLNYLEDATTPIPPNEKGLPKRFSEQPRKLYQMLGSHLDHLKALYEGFDYNEMSKFEVVNQLATFGVKLQAIVGQGERRKRGSVSAQKYNKLCKAIGNYETRNGRENLIELLKEFRMERDRFGISLFAIANNPNNQDLASLFHAMKKDMIKWCDEQFVVVENNRNEDKKWRKTADLFNLKEKKNHASELQKQIKEVYLKHIMLPNGFVKNELFTLKHEVLIPGENGKPTEEAKQNMKQPNVNSKILNLQHDKDLLADFYLPHVSEANRISNKKLYEIASRDKLLLEMAKEYAKKLVPKVADNKKGNWNFAIQLIDKEGNTNSQPSVKDLLHAEVEASHPANKKMSFKIKASYKMLTILNDPRINDVEGQFFTIYFDHKEEQDLQALKETLKQISSEQLGMVNEVLLTEEAIIEQLKSGKSEEEAELLMQELKNGSNRIELKILLDKSGLGNQLENLIKTLYARKKAFHNGIPDLKTFKHYQEELKSKRETWLESLN
jgi:hypothetical protein